MTHTTTIACEHCGCEYSAEYSYDEETPAECPACSANLTLFTDTNGSVVVVLESYDAWNDHREVADQPQWLLQQPLTYSDCKAIEQGGCASGAYMPAVTYYTATQTMAEYGDAITEYVQDMLGDDAAPKPGLAWSHQAVWWFSCAVELFASAALADLE